MGVLRVTSPNGDVWWVKRAWVPRYRGMRDRVGDYLEVRPPRWYHAPLRVYARGYDRWVREGAIDPLNSAASVPWPGLPPDAAGALGPSPVPDGSDFSPDIAHALGFDAGGTDIGGGGAGFGFPPYPDQTPLLDLGGGGDLTGSALAGLPGAGPFPDLGGGGDLGSGAAAAGAGAGSGAGSAGGGGGDGSDLGAVILIAFVVIFVAVAVGWVLLPLLLAVVDGLVLLIAIVAAGAVRVLMKRPWDVVATQDLPDGLQLVRRWELRGYRRAGHARDDVARALETGTDADLAVARVVVREPMPADPAGLARSEREVHWR